MESSLRFTSFIIEKSDTLRWGSQRESCQIEFIYLLTLKDTWLTTFCHSLCVLKGKKMNIEMATLEVYTWEINSAILKRDTPFLSPLIQIDLKGCASALRLYWYIQISTDPQTHTVPKFFSSHMWLHFHLNANCSFQWHLISAVNQALGIGWKAYDTTHGWS